MEKMMQKLYEILATAQYNSERQEFLEMVLAKLLAERDSQLDIVSEVRRLFETKSKATRKPHGESKNGELLESEYFKAFWFAQESVLLSNIPQEYIPDYVMGKFSSFNEEFLEKYKFDFHLLWLFAFKLNEYISFKKISTGFSDQIYAFRSKREYADLGFVKIPHSVFIEHWKNLITINKDELGRIFFGALSSQDISKVLQILSIDIENIPKESENIHFPSKPILKAGNEIIVLAPRYLCRALPQNYERLFKQCKGYLNSKGKAFEKIVQDIIRQTMARLIVFNAKYGKKNEFEADAIVGFEKSLWFIEASSHPPSSESLRGDLYHIRNDLNRTLKKCVAQGKRALRNLENISLPNPFKGLEHKGIIIVADGVYPNLNLDSFINLSENENIPIYMINYFDLRTLLAQPELQAFEEFLLWRTQRPMPVICLDEKDYWGYYFDRYLVLQDIRDTFRTMQEKQIKMVYISYRFNRKDYLARMPRKEYEGSQ